MPFEQRLHPATLLFDLVRHLKAFALPAVLLIFGMSRSDEAEMFRYGPFSSSGWEVWLLILIVPAAITSVARYLSFRLRLDERELVVKSGIIFRKERHIPFSRIQNVDAIENVLHRVFGVIEVRVETGGGNEEEARLSVLPRTALDEIRHHVFADRRLAHPAHPAHPAHLVHLNPRELLLYGILDNRGLILVGALFGALWETGLPNRLMGWAFASNSFGRGVSRDFVRAVLGDGPMPWGGMAVAAAALVAFLVIARVASTMWALSRLYDFRLTRIGEDLRTAYGLFTRVTATVPMRRVQTIIISDGPLHRLAARTSVRVETAGGGGSGGREQGRSATPAREWLAPLIRRTEVPTLLGQVLPGFTLDAVDWQPVHPGAFRRAVKPMLILSVVGSLGASLVLGWRAIFLFAILAAWSLLSARKYVDNLGWAEADEVVLMKSGWLRRQVTVARVNKIQAVALHESPFDRRSAMASVKVDTAGASEFTHRVHIPYLDRGVAGALAHRVSEAAASTAFRW